MPVNITLQTPVQPAELGDAINLLQYLLDRKSEEDGDDETLGAAVPSPGDPPGPPPLTTARTPAEAVDAWFSHLGQGSRRFWRIAARYALDHPESQFTFEDLAAASGLTKGTLRSYHRNSYRAIKDEQAPDPMPGAWSQVTQRTDYMMFPGVAQRIAELTQNDPD